MESFYNDKCEKLLFDLSKSNIINGGDAGLYGKIYSVGDELCLKKLNHLGDIDYRIIKAIRDLKLKNFYEIYDLLFNKKGEFKGYTMKYYKKEDFNIFTMPTYYTLNNLFNIYSSMLKLTEECIHVSDMHEDNVILDSNNITVIDVDLYNFSCFLLYEKLLEFNVNSVKNLFKRIYYRNVDDYYDDNCFDYISIISHLYNKINSKVGLELFFSEIEDYKYPIDYIKKLSKTRGVN